MQTKGWSALESAANTIIGLALQGAVFPFIVFPLIGLHTAPSESAIIGLTFALLGFVRAYVLRRIFNKAFTPPD